jgi:hypothetical protein
MPESIPIPDTAKDRPLYQDLLVPYTVRWFDGIPDFKVSDEKAIFRCVRNRLCGLCGKKLGRYMTFIGGPLSMHNKLFTDPAMHRLCAEYALQVCPFLSGDIRAMATTYKHDAERILSTVDNHRPERFGLLETHACGFVQFRNETYIKTEEPAIITWWMPNS